MGGIVGLTKLFRDEALGLPEGAVVVFIGSSAVCAPFAELLAYSVRDRKFDLYFSPMANEMDCRPLLWNEGTGYGISHAGGEVVASDMIVVLGGLAMPKFGCPVEGVQRFIGKVAGQGTAKVVGVCFMDILKRSGWTDCIKFDALINATMEVEKADLTEEWAA
jgi:hypothetical protein